MRASVETVYRWKYENEIFHEIFFVFASKYYIKIGIYKIQKIWKLFKIATERREINLSFRNKQTIAKWLIVHKFD